jgi:hypothetical protein
MSFKLWESIRKNEDLYNTCKDIQENLLDDYFNFDDSSVGIYSVGRIDESLVKEFENNEFDGCRIKKWEDYSFMLQVDTNKENKKHLLVIKFDSYSENWEIKNAIVKRIYDL